LATAQPNILTITFAWAHTINLVLIKKHFKAQSKGLAPYRGARKIESKQKPNPVDR